MKKDKQDAKSIYDVEKDKSTGIGLAGLTGASSSKVTKNEKGEIEFEIEVSSVQEEPPKEEKKKKNFYLKKLFSKKHKEIKDDEEVTETEDLEEDDTLETSEEEIEEDEEIEDEENEAYEDESDTDIFKAIKTVIKILLITAVIIFIGVAVWAINSPVFSVTKIKLDETNKIDRNQVLMLASGDRGQNIFTVNFGALKSSIEKLPYVYKVKLIRNLPDEIEINIEERIEYLAILENERAIYIDQYGYVMAETKYDNLIEVPVITGIGIDNYKVSDTLKGTDMVKFKNFRFFLETAESVDFGYDFSNIDYKDSEKLSFTISGTQIDVLYGEIIKDQASDKLIYLKEIIKKCVDNNFKGMLDYSAENYLENTIFKRDI